MRAKDVRKLGRAVGSAAARRALRYCSRHPEVCPTCFSAAELGEQVFEERMLSLDWVGPRGVGHVQDFLRTKQEWREFDQAARSQLVHRVALACRGRR